MKRLLSIALFAALACLSFAPAPALAQQYQGNGVIPSTLCSAVTPGFPNQCAPTIGDTAFYAAATTTLTQFIPAPTAPSAIRFTFLQFEALESATGGDLLLEQGTGTNCGTSTAVVAKLAYMGSTTYVSGSFGNGNGTVFKLKPGFAACIGASGGTITSAAVAGTAAIW